MIDREKVAELAKEIAKTAQNLEKAEWCECGKSQWAIHKEDNVCECGIGKHHYHCEFCGKVVQIG